MNSASVAYAYRQIVNKYFDKTVSEKAVTRIDFENGKMLSKESNAVLANVKSAVHIHYNYHH